MATKKKKESRNDNKTIQVNLNFSYFLLKKGITVLVLFMELIMAKMEISGLVRLRQVHFVLTENHFDGLVRRNFRLFPYLVHMNMQQTIIFLFILGILITAQGQNDFAPKVDLYDYSQEKWDSLEQLNVEPIIELEWGSHDDVWVIDKPDSCICKGYQAQKFFLWEVSGNQYLQKVTCCRIYEPRAFESRKIFKILVEKQALLAKETYQTTSVSPSAYIQLKHQDHDGKRLLLFFDQSMLDPHSEPEYWRENRKLRTHKVLKRVVRMVNREWGKSM